MDRRMTMPIFDEAAAVEVMARAFSDECDRMAPGDGQPPVVWETLDEDSQDRFRQASRASLAALKPLLGGETPQNESAFDEIKRLQREIGTRQMRLQFLVLGDPTKGVSGRAQTLLDEIAASPDKGGE